MGGAGKGRGVMRIWIDRRRGGRGRGVGVRRPLCLSALSAQTSLALALLPEGEVRVRGEAHDTPQLNQFVQTREVHAEAAETLEALHRLATPRGVDQDPGHHTELVGKPNLGSENQLGV